MAKLIKYRGILFDDWDWSTDEDGTKWYWAEVCGSHGLQFADVLKGDLSDGGMGSCSICGCDLVGMDIDEEEDEINGQNWYYIDFDPKLIEFIEE